MGQKLCELFRPCCRHLFGQPNIRCRRSHHHLEQRSKICCADQQRTHLSPPRLRLDSTVIAAEGDPTMETFSVSGYLLYRCKGTMPEAAAKSQLVDHLQIDWFTHCFIYLIYAALQTVGAALLFTIPGCDGTNLNDSRCRVQRFAGR